MDRSNTHHNESLSRGDSAGGGQSRSRKRTPKDPNLMSPAEFRREIKRIWTKKMSKAERLAAVRSGFGAWKDRPEWKGMTSLEIAAELRRRSLSRGGHG